jgi:microcystin-dependent protein
MTGALVADLFLLEIRIVSFNVPLKGWAFCNGQLLPINQNQALFSLLGTQYGGNGQTNFALPDVRGRTPIHFGNGHTLGESSGQEFHTLAMPEIPAHTHVLNASANVATAAAPSATRVPAQSVGAQLYGAPAGLVAMNPASISNVGGSQAHENRQPYAVLNFCIALQGIFPSHA